MSVSRTIYQSRKSLLSTLPRSFIRPVSIQSRNMSNTNVPIENTNVSTAEGVDLSAQQKTIVGSVLDLFAGRPSLEKLQLWTDEAVFEDPITVARGRKQFEPQWYGLQSAFSEIERLHHKVTSAGNPITMELKTRYVVKGINKEQTINSIIEIKTTADGSKIEYVADKWDGELPDSSIKNVSLRKAINPFWWANYWLAWAFWAWSFVWYTRPWMAFRRLNAVTVPKLISVPKDKKEDAERGN